MKKIIFLLGILTLTLSSCMKEDDIRILDFEDFDMRSNTLFDMTFRVENKSRKNVRIKDADLILKYGGSEIMRAILQEEVVIPKKSVGSITIPLRVKLDNPMAFIGMVMTNRFDINNITISGEVKVKAGAMSRTFRQEDVPVARHLRAIGIDSDEILKQFSL